MANTVKKPTQPTTIEQAPRPRTEPESPRTFYDRLAKREDIRRLLARLAKL